MFGEGAVTSCLITTDEIQRCFWKDVFLIAWVRQGPSGDLTLLFTQQISSNSSTFPNQIDPLSIENNMTNYNKYVHIKCFAVL